MGKKTIITGAIICMLAVIIGAFGSHALKPILTANQRLDTFDIGVKYQIFHGLALLITGILQIIKPNKLWSYSALFFALGVLIFSGSLYVLSMTNQAFLGAVTPLGGVCFIIGWIFFSISTVKSDWNQG